MYDPMFWLIMLGLPIGLMVLYSIFKIVEMFIKNDFPTVSREEANRMTQDASRMMALGGMINHHDGPFHHHHD